MTEGAAVGVQGSEQRRKDAVPGRSGADGPEIIQHLQENVFWFRPFRSLSLLSEAGNKQLSASAITHSRGKTCKQTERK